MLKKDITDDLGTLGDPEYKNFDQLTMSIITPPVLALTKHILTYNIYTESIYLQVGWDLFQTHTDGERKPIGFW